MVLQHRHKVGEATQPSLRGGLAWFQGAGKVAEMWGLVIGGVLPRHAGPIDRILHQCDQSVRRRIGRGVDAELAIIG